MKKLISITALLLAPIGAQANKENECNIAINNVADNLREQSMLSIETHNSDKFSRQNIETMVKTSQEIIKESERILSLCNLDRVMTEGVLDVIINNTEQVEKLTYDSSTIK